MRSRKAIINTVAGFSYELVAIICGFILPRLILTAFGSDYNGISTSISQFLGYITLLKAGIGGVTKAALYKPLADRDYKAISGVITATNQFLRKVSILFFASLLAFASVYPFLVKSNFDWFFSFSLVLIIGISSFAQYFFGLTYQLLLYADQRQSVVSVIQIITTIIITIISAIIIRAGATLHIVKLVSSVVFCLNPVCINIYARHYYKIDKTVPANKDAIKDRWDCFGLQVANFINSNTDTMVLTIFTNVFEVSVYTVYHMVTSGVRQILNTFVNGIGAAFGDMFARNEKEIAKNNLLLFEEIVFGLSNFFFSVCFVMIVPFVQIYTADIYDVNYTRYAFAYVSTTAILFTCYRIPYQALVEAVGHFKQTKNGAFFEAGLNILLSIIMVHKFGLVGVAIGTLAAAVFRTFQYYLYISKNVIERSIWILIKRLMLSSITFAFVFLFARFSNTTKADNIFQWVGHSIVVSLFALFIVLIIELLFYRKDLLTTIKKVKVALRHI